MSPRWRPGRQRYSDFFRRAFGTEVGPETLDAVMPVAVVEDTGTRDMFGAQIEVQTNSVPHNRPALVALWPGDREVVVHGVYPRLIPPIPNSNNQLMCWAFSPPAAYRFLRFNAVAAIGPGFGAIYGRDVDPTLRQSTSLIVGGNPGVALDGGQTIAEGASGHPVVPTGGGPIVLRGPEYWTYMNGLNTQTQSPWPKVNLLAGPVRLRRFDPLCVITANPTLTGALYTYTDQVNLQVNFLWSEIDPAYDRTRNGFIGSV